MTEDNVVCFHEVSTIGLGKLEIQRVARKAEVISNQQRFRQFG